MITNNKFNVDLASFSEKKLMYVFAKEKNFDVKTPGNKINRDRTLIKSLKSPGLMVSAFGVSSFHKKKSSSKTIFLSSDPDELC